MIQRLLRSASVLLVPLVAAAAGQSEFEQTPICYSSSSPQDRIAALNKLLESRVAKLEWDKKHGWLPSLLQRLEVPASSQTLVFSKTSLQIRKISPRKPRAIYFNDDVYVGWVQHGDFVELSAVDSELGAVFYKIKQDPKEPHLIRDNGECLACHATRRTQQVPGYLVRSAFTKSTGHPEFRLGTTTTDHTTNFSDRFGGWYVTGHHGEMRHRGNAVLRDGHSKIDSDLHANRMKLPQLVASEDYLTNTSDIVALMVLEHQTQMHNWITKACYTARRAMHQQSQMNKVLHRPQDFRSESTTRRIDAVTEKLLRYTLFCDEFPLASPVIGNSKFATEFEAGGIRDQSGRSLREFDMKTRMFRYPCSFLIYSDSFRQLPSVVLKRFATRLGQVLRGEDTSPAFNHLTSQDREAIHGILVSTHGILDTVDGRSPIEKIRP